MSRDIDNLEAQYRKKTDDIFARHQERTDAILADYQRNSEALLENFRRETARVTKKTFISAAIGGSIILLIASMIRT